MLIQMQIRPHTPVLNIMVTYTTRQSRKDKLTLDITTHNAYIEDVYCNTANNTLGYLRSTDKTWLSTDTWRKIEERKTIKSKILNTKSKRTQELLQLEYSIKDKEIKKSARHYKRVHVDNIAMKVETAAERGEMSTVYRPTKQLCRHTKACESIVKDKEGNPLTTEETQARRWVEHFSEVLNRESVTITVDTPPPHQLMI